MISFVRWERFNQWRSKSLLSLQMSDMLKEPRNSKQKKTSKKWFMCTWHGLNYGVDPSSTKTIMSISLDAISCFRFCTKSQIHLMTHQKKTKRSSATFHISSFKQQQLILVISKPKSSMESAKMCSRNSSTTKNKSKKLWKQSRKKVKRMMNRYLKYKHYLIRENQQYRIWMEVQETRRWEIQWWQVHKIEQRWKKRRCALRNSKNNFLSKWVHQFTSSYQMILKWDKEPCSISLKYLTR